VIDPPRNVQAKKSRVGLHLFLSNIPHELVTPSSPVSVELFAVLALYPPSLSGVNSAVKFRPAGSRSRRF
jgi:hypothetical protein